MAYKSVGNVITVAAGGASTASSAFNQQTEYLRVVAIGTAAHVAVSGFDSTGIGVSAYQDSSTYLAADTPEIIAMGKVASQPIVGITTAAGDGGTGFSNLVITIPEGQYAQFPVNATVSATVDGQDWFNFTNKRVKSVNTGFAPTSANPGFGAQLTIIDGIAGNNAIATAFAATLGSSPRAAELRSSQKIAAINSQFTAGKNITVTAQQVQIVGG